MTNANVGGVVPVVPVLLRMRVGVRAFLSFGVVLGSALPNRRAQRSAVVDAYSGFDSQRTPPAGGPAPSATHGQVAFSELPTKTDAGNTGGLISARIAFGKLLVVAAGRVVAIQSAGVAIIFTIDANVLRAHASDTNVVAAAGSPIL